LQIVDLKFQKTGEEEEENEEEEEPCGEGGGLNMS
jgi:hypothetical protein